MLYCYVEVLIFAEVLIFSDVWALRCFTSTQKPSCFLMTDWYAETFAFPDDWDWLWDVYRFRGILYVSVWLAGVSSILDFYKVTSCTLSFAHTSFLFLSVGMHQQHEREDFSDSLISTSRIIGLFLPSRSEESSHLKRRKISKAFRRESMWDVPWGNITRMSLPFFVFTLTDWIVLFHLTKISGVFWWACISSIQQERLWFVRLLAHVFFPQSAATCAFASDTERSWKCAGEHA